MAYAKTVEVIGADELQKTLRGLTTKGAYNRVMRPTLRQGARLIVRAAKMLAPKRSGALRKSLSAEPRTPQNSGIYMVIGPRRGFMVIHKGRKHDPANIAHLVEHGHEGPHPAPAHPFLEPAIRNTQPKVGATMVARAKEEVEKEAARQARKHK